MSTPLRLWVAVSLVLGPLTGFILGRWTAPEAGEGSLLRELAQQRALLEEHLARESRPSSEVRCAVAAAPGTAVDLARLRSEVVQALREELASRPASAGQDADAGRQSPTPESSAKNLAAIQAGQRVLDDATQARRWTSDDRLALRRAMGEMTPAQRVEVLRRLTIAINARTLEVQTQGSPL